ncbi:hypothetical protein GCM10011361_04360 [Muriicola marianensis]|uniref:Uncharacterized protein n=1 Tax=Muriicola marianensis TaxID=1324801 RepID=A0ABQ1QSU0_9FLAO|nr:hypothetical protein GCM10011361_04360 [Muriicola marianensis]
MEGAYAPFKKTVGRVHFHRIEIWDYRFTKEKIRNYPYSDLGNADFFDKM